MTKNRKMAAIGGVSLVAIAVGVAVLILQLTGDKTVDAATLSARASNQEAALTSAIDAGATLHIKMEVYDKDRLYPEGFVPPEFHYPDRQIQEVWLGTDEKGLINFYEGAIYDTEGKYLASVTVGDGQWVQIDADTGERFAVRAATGALKLNDWISAKFAVADRLTADGFKNIGSTEYLGRAAVVFELKSPGTTDRITLAESNPVLFSESLWSTTSSQPTLEKETKIVAIETIPAGQPLGIPTPAMR